MTDGERNCPLNSINGIAILIVIGIVGIGLLAMGLKDTNITISPEPLDNTLSVSSSFEMMVDPDMVTVSIGVSHLMPTASQAQQAVNAAMNDIVEGLKDIGLTEDDIETANITLYEERRWIKEEYETVGWRASQTMTITTNDLSKAGPIIDVSVDNGANQINGVTFTLSNEAERQYRSEALESAGELAKGKAEAIANGLDVELGGVKSVSESSFYYYPYNASYDVKEESGSAPSVVIPGDVTVTATLSVVYYID
ncbi:MAG: SIMPL domain-containing protein [Candidatus Methanofastidiosa archaeon]|nr:SIMPL domain-containing protein [Candidatus Methanofastidiosa archaeon]